MTTFTKMPAVIAFDRKLEPSDALMYSGKWESIESDSLWKEIELFDRHNRAVKSNFKPEVLNDEAELQKQIAEANLAWGDDAALSHDHDTLKLSFTLRVVSGLSRTSACNDVDFEAAYKEKIQQYVQSNIINLASRYAYNIANGRFLLRNRVGAQELKIVVNHTNLKEPLIFNAYDYSLKNTTSENALLAKLTELIKSGFESDTPVLLSIQAYSKLGNGQRIWPSQEMILNSPKGEKSRHLFALNVNGKDVAAMHCEKIGNALRTIDDWYPSFNETQTPIAVEAYGSVTQRGVAYRSTKNDFKTLLLKWLNSTDSGTLNNDEQDFVVAMLIRGGVFGEGES